MVREEERQGREHMRGPPAQRKAARRKQRRLAALGEEGEEDSRNVC